MKQCMAALAYANEVRDQRRLLKERLKARELHVADLVEHPPGVVANVPVGDLLRWQPRVGRYRATLLLETVDGRCPVIQLSDARRLELAARLRLRVAS